MTNYHIIPHNRALSYILAGKALFTIENKETQSRYTYKIIVDKKRNSIYHIGVMYKYDKFMYVGMLSTYNNKIYPAISNKAKSYIVINWLYANLKQNLLPEQINIYHHSKCGKCGRTLTLPSSILDGIGEECKRQLKGTRFVHPELYEQNR
jgi:hypothetical protein